VAKQETHTAAPTLEVASFHVVASQVKAETSGASRDQSSSSPSGGVSGQGSNLDGDGTFKLEAARHPNPKWWRQ
jgi:hypothetical protein